MRLLRNFQEVTALFDALFPICRSITGDGLRRSLDILGEYIPLERVSFKTGERVLNWTIPQEWHIFRAFVKNSKGETVIDFSNSNLHVMGYSDAVDEIVSLEELKQHVYTSEKRPDATPYITSYYRRQWGFCMSRNQLSALPEDRYHAFIDSTHADGQLDIGHVILPGNSEKEVLLSSYLCHPSMANNELSGPIVLVMLYQKILKWNKRNLTYRFVVNPETIGSIAYLSKYGEELKNNLFAGVVFTCLGKSNDPKCDLSFKMSRNESSEINKIMHHLKIQGQGIGIRKFSPLSGSDERQYCSPGFNLPVGQISSLLYGQYPEYHTSDDTKELMGIEALIENAERLEAIFMAIDADGYYINTHPYGEVKLGDYDLYPTTSCADCYSKVSNDSLQDARNLLNAVLMILSYSDGKHSLLDIANMLSVNILKLRGVVDLLLEKGLLEGPFYEEREL